MLKRIIKTFRAKNLFHLVIIFIVFGITGSLSVFLGKYVLILFGDSLVQSDFYWLFRLIIIFPLYQLLLILVGTIFGQFRYFWEIEKRILIRMRLLKSTRS